MNPTDLILARFEQISAIPRGTKNEAGIRTWLQEWATVIGLFSRVDAIGNLLIRVPASAGYEDQPVLILQGHMDMVCQKTSDSQHDFTRDPIQIMQDGDWIRADGTSLGADNGIAIAIMMAVVEDGNLAHPALELLLTVEEELGLRGADQLEPDMLSGKTMINLDSEEEGVFTIGCAGGGSLYFALPVHWENHSANEMAFKVQVNGLLGGHSGEDINKHRGHANKLLARILDTLQSEVPMRLASLKGGSARNAIPREATAIFSCANADAELCQEQFARIRQTILTEYKKLEEGMTLTLTPIPEPVQVIRQAETVTAIRLLVCLPQGVSAMSADIPGFVETSNNIGIIELKEEGLLMVSNHRSAIFSRLEESIRRVEALAWLAGAQTERTKLFGPWQPNQDSPLLKKSLEVYRSSIGKEAVVNLAHGGVECGLISDRCGGLDTISLGPTVEHPHTPDERLYIPSLSKVWIFLAALFQA